MPPEQIQSCSDEPDKPSGEYTEKDVAIYMTNLYFAWSDCFFKVEQIRSFTESESNI